MTQSSTNGVAPIRSIDGGLVMIRVILGIVFIYHGGPLAFTGPGRYSVGGSTGGAR